MSECGMGWRRQPAVVCQSTGRVMAGYLVWGVRAQDRFRGHPHGRLYHRVLSELKQSEGVMHVGKKLGSGCQGLFWVTKASFQGENK